MNKKILIGSIGAAVLLVLVSFSSIVSAQTIKSQKTNFTINSILTKLKNKNNLETSGIIGGIITISGGLLIVFLILLYIGIASNNDVALNILVKIISTGLNILQYIFIFMIGYMVAAGMGTLPPFLKMLEPILVPMILGLAYAFFIIMHILDPDIIM
ncbi:MAG: hypothetical protein NT038_02180 [Euryarchaeota archaeon]|nr:hypothetical protein [Euryarchaeota archaeon]